MQAELLTSATQELAYSWLVRHGYGQSNAYATIYMGAHPVALSYGLGGDVVALASCLSDGTCTEFHGDTTRWPELVGLLAHAIDGDSLSFEEDDLTEAAVSQLALLGFARAWGETAYQLATVEVR